MAVSWRAPVAVGALRSPCTTYLAQLAPPCGLRRFCESSKCSSSSRLQCTSAQEAMQAQTSSDQEEQAQTTDSVLPENLEGAIRQSADSTTRFLLEGGKRGIVDLTIDDLESLDLDGGRQQLWDCSKLFLELLQENFQDKQFKAIFPDAGAAALLEFQWTDATFKFGSLSDRRPVSEDDEIIVLVCPDYQMLSEVRKVASSLVGDDYEMKKPLVMWNPRLSSGDVGVGLSIRRMRKEFLSTFTTVYSLRSYPVGAVFKRYPGLWQIFLENKQEPGRYTYVREQALKPGEDDLERILLAGSTEAETSGGGGGGASFMATAMASLSSFGRFVRSLSR